jgi:hypothetical protein
MKRIALVLVLALVLPAAAAAKGPASGHITGPGLDRPIELTGHGEPGSVGTLGRVAEQSGLFAALGGSRSVFGTNVQRYPKVDLGARYTAWFTMPDADARTVRVYLYPHARPVPVTYVPTGQQPFGTGTMGGGWYVADDDLVSTLREAGLPPPRQASATDGGFDLPSSFIAAALAAALGLATAAALVFRRRFATVR